MFLPKMFSYFQKSPGKLPRKFLYVSRRHIAGSFKMMSPSNSGEYFEKTMYSLLPSKTYNSYTYHLQKVNKITPDMWFSQEKRDEFLSYFPDVVKQIQTKAACLDEIENGRHIANILEHVSYGGKKYLGVVTAETYKMLIPESEKTPENIKLGYYLGWCVELMVDSFNMVDDITDEGETRRNRPCWHRVGNNKLTAVNDSFMVLIGMQYLLRNNFEHHKCYIRLIELFNESCFMLSIGQHVNINSIEDALKLYTETLNNLCISSASYLPVVLGVTLAGYSDPEVVKKAQSIMTQLGYFYLIENDYTDSFGDHAVTGKVGRDIQMGRWRWPLIAFMEYASPEQKSLMLANYGKDTEENVAIVKQLFEDVNIHQIFDNYTAQLYDKLMKDIEENSYGDMKKVYLKLVESLSCSTQAGGCYS